MKFVVVEPTEMKNGVVKPANNLAKDASSPFKEGSAGSSAALHVGGLALATCCASHSSTFQMETGDVTRGQSSPAWRNLLATVLPGADRT